jgi:hypothetical protein
VVGCCECGDEPAGSGATELTIYRLWHGLYDDGMICGL